MTDLGPPPSGHAYVWRDQSAGVARSLCLRQYGVEGLIVGYVNICPPICCGGVLIGTRDHCIWKV